MSREGIEKFLVKLLPEMGLRPLPLDGAVLFLDPAQDAYRVRVALPLKWVPVILDRAMLEDGAPNGAAVGALVGRWIEDARKTLFADTRRHLDEHGDSHGRAVTLSARDVEILNDALGIWNSDYNDAPVDEIAELRIRLKALGAR